MTETKKADDSAKTEAKTAEAKPTPTEAAQARAAERAAADNPGKTESASDPTSTKPAANAEAVEQLLAEANNGPEFIAIGRLRRDTMILGAGEAEEMNKLGAEAVTSGRAAEVYVLPVVGYFSESLVNFVEPDTHRVSGFQRGDEQEARVPLLNPSTGEQAADVSAAETDAAEVPAPTQGATGHAAET